MPQSGVGALTATLADCLIDTNVASYMLRDDSRAAAYRTYPTARRVALSFMTIAEMRRWALARNWGPQRQRELEAFLVEFTVFFADDVLCTAWAAIVDERMRIGRPIDTADAWVAAPAWLLALPLVTHNARHFADIAGLQVISLGCARDDALVTNCTKRPGCDRLPSRLRCP